jgi:hypothetical protein
VRPQLPVVSIREGMHEQRYVVVQHADGSERTLETGSGCLNYSADLIGVETLGPLLQHLNQLASQAPSAAS